MNEAEYKSLNEVRGCIITADDLVNKEPRTLISGYTCLRDSFRVELDNDLVIRSYLNGVALPVEENRDYIPDKRAIAQDCDYEFCKLLLAAGEYICFYQAADPWNTGVFKKDAS